MRHPISIVNDFERGRKKKLKRVKHQEFAMISLASKLFPPEIPSLAGAGS